MFISPAKSPAIATFRKATASLSLQGRGDIAAIPATLAISQRGRADASSPKNKKRRFFLFRCRRQSHHLLRKMALPLPSCPWRQCRRRLRLERLSILVRLMPSFTRGDAAHDDFTAIIFSWRECRYSASLRALRRTIAGADSLERVDARQSTSGLMPDVGGVACAPEHLAALTLF